LIIVVRTATSVMNRPKVKINPKANANMILEPRLESHAEACHVETDLRE
jgi:hypothetical protein